VRTLTLMMIKATANNCQRRRRVYHNADAVNGPDVAATVVGHRCRLPCDGEMRCDALVDRHLLLSTTACCRDSLHSDLSAKTKLK